MSVSMDSDHDAGLSLCLGLGPPASHLRRKDTSAAEPSLTLSLSDDAYNNGPTTPKSELGRPSRLSSPHSAVSSYSAAYPAAAYPAAAAGVKRERDSVAIGEEAEDERGITPSRISDEDEDGNAKKKLRLTKEQSALLEDRFKEQITLNPKQKQALAKQLGLRPRQVEVWFQNRRARTKLKQTEVDCELLKRCWETLTDENRRLQKEVTELRAMKFARPPLYMQLPAATLTMCPSCERLAGDGPMASVAAAPPKTRFFNPFTHSATC